MGATGSSEDTRFIFTADLHLTDRPEDEYRWPFLDWLGKRCEQHQAQALFILGDLTHRKNNHSASLVNRLVGKIEGLSCVCPVYILCGNHDLDNEDGPPFFLFLRGLNRVEFVWRRIQVLDIRGRRVCFVPYSHQHTLGPVAAATRIRRRLAREEPLDLVLVHHCLRGASATSGQRLGGIDPRAFGSTRALVLAGDIHVPQRVGRVTYVGSPYPVDFGETHDPRVLLLHGNSLESLPVPSIRKRTLVICSMEELGGIDPGDHVKVRLHLERSQLSDWPIYRQQIREVVEGAGARLCGMELLTSRDERVPGAPDSPDDPDGAPGGLPVQPVRVVGAYCRAARVRGERRRVGIGLCRKVQDERAGGVHG